MSGMTGTCVGRYRSWDDCVYLQSNDVSIVITTQVGPRVISCSVAGGPNIFKVFEMDSDRVGDAGFKLFGGHRLWHAPEAFPRSYSPDLDPVPFRVEPGLVQLNQIEEADTKIRKSIEIRCLTRGGFQVRHQLVNNNLWPIELAPWCLTMFAAGSRAIVPNETFRPHSDCLDAARTMTLWHYSRMDDPRVTWGSRFVQLSDDQSVGGQFKLGMMNKQRWAACWVGSCLFIKTFHFDPRARYADLGSNCEVFTTAGFVEVESLGPLTRLEPGDAAFHDEIWHVWSVENLPAGDAELATALEPYIEQLTYPVA